MFRSAFRYSCSFGDLDISANNEEVFCNACFSGHLDIAQWLLQVKPDINISAENEEAFRFACRNGHLDVAQWLLSIKPDINVNANCGEIFNNENGLLCEATV